MFIAEDHRGSTDEISTSPEFASSWVTKTCRSNWILASRLNRTRSCSQPFFSFITSPWLKTRRMLASHLPTASTSRSLRWRSSRGIVTHRVITATCRDSTIPLEYLPIKELENKEEPMLNHGFPLGVCPWFPYVSIGGFHWGFPFGVRGRTTKCPATHIAKDLLSHPGLLLTSEPFHFIPRMGISWGRELQMLPSGKLTWPWKITIFSKSTNVLCPFPIANCKTFTRDHMRLKGIWWDFTWLEDAKCQTSACQPSLPSNSCSPAAFERRLQILSGIARKACTCWVRMTLWKVCKPW